MMHRSPVSNLWHIVTLALVLVSLSGLVPALNSTSLAAAPSVGCDGSIMVHKDAGEPDPITAGILVLPPSGVSALPRVGLFHLHAVGFDAGSLVGWVIKNQADGTQVLAGELSIRIDGSNQTNQLRLQNGQYVVYYHEAGCPAGDKSQEFSVERQETGPAETINPAINPGVFTAPGNLPSSGRASVSVVCRGCWSSVAQVWVGGTEQSPQVLAPDASGALAALWTFWNSSSWQIRVRVTLPVGLNTNRWKLIAWVGTGPQDYIWADDVTFRLDPHQLSQVVFQLVDTYSWQ
jgi:hypothetical protein